MISPIVIVGTGLLNQLLIKSRIKARTATEVAATRVTELRCSERWRLDQAPQTPSSRIWRLQCRPSRETTLLGPWSNGTALCIPPPVDPAEVELAG
jgi:hypothetical protein